MPGHEDELRWRAEAAARTGRQLSKTVRDLVRQSLPDGHEHAAMLDGAAMGVQVLADQATRPTSRSGSSARSPGGS